MKDRLLHENRGMRTFAVVLETGDEALGCLQAFVKGEKVFAAQVSGIGAFSEAVLGYFDWQKKEYRPNSISEQVEVTSRCRPTESRPCIFTLCLVALTVRRSPDTYCRVACGRPSK